MTPNSNYRRWEQLAAHLAAAEDNATHGHIREAIRQLHNAAAVCGRHQEFGPASETIKHAIWEITRWSVELTATTPARSILTARQQIALDPQRAWRAALHEGFKARKAARAAARRAALSQQDNERNK